jgi:hypothetical protein
MKGYVFGNGASIPYGSPVSARIFRHGIQLLLDAVRTGDANRREVFRRLLGEVVRCVDDLRGELARGTLNGLHVGRHAEPLQEISYAVTLERCDPSRVESLMQDLDAWHIWELFPEIYSYYLDDKPHGFLGPGFKRHAVIDYDGSLYDNLANLSLLIIYCALKDSQKQPVAYERFARWLATQSDLTPIVNLNYDTLLDDSLEGAGLLVSRCGIDGPSPLEHSRTAAVPRVQLAKPHGSFDYVCCDECETLEHDTHVPIDTFYFRIGRRKCSHCQNWLRHYFIPYARTDLPLRHKQILARSLVAAEQALQGVDELDVIGYSFTSQGGQLVDRHLDFVFGGRHLVVISSTAAKSKKICASLRSIGYDAVAHEASGFEDYARTLS